ncbi:MAG: wax ester/triacylglycerol synthase domain-containing protein [Mycobacteriaceae bacterium]
MAVLRLNGRSTVIHSAQVAVNMASLALFVEPASGPPNVAEIHQWFHQRIGKENAFRLRIEPDLIGISNPRLVIDEAFHIKNHVVIHKRPDINTLTSMFDTIRALADSPLDPHHPLWRVVIITGGTLPGRLLGKDTDELFPVIATSLVIDHCWADGKTFREFNNRLFPASNDRPGISYPSITPLHPDPVHSRLILTLTALLKLPLRLSSMFAQFLGALLITKKNAKTAQKMGLPAEARKEAPFSFHRSAENLGGTYSQTWISAEEMASMRAYAPKATITSVALTLIARHLNESFFDESDKQRKTLLVAVPTSIRKADDISVDNLTSHMIVPVPLGIPNFGDQLNEVSQRMLCERRRAEVTPRVNFDAIVGLLPAPVVRLGLKILLARHNRSVDIAPTQWHVRLHTVGPGAGTRHFLGNKSSRLFGLNYYDKNPQPSIEIVPDSGGFTVTVLTRRSLTPTSEIGSAQLRRTIDTILLSTPDH